MGYGLQGLTNNAAKVFMQKQEAGKPENLIGYLENVGFGAAREEDEEEEEQAEENNEGGEEVKEHTVVGVRSIGNTERRFACAFEFRFDSAVEAAVAGNTPTIIAFLGWLFVV